MKICPYCGKELKDVERHVVRVHPNKPWPPDKRKVSVNFREQAGDIISNARFLAKKRIEEVRDHARKITGGIEE